MYTCIHVYAHAHTTCAHLHAPTPGEGVRILLVVTIRAWGPVSMASPGPDARVQPKLETLRVHVLDDRLHAVYGEPHERGGP